jgi:DnaJ-class molecular chaperone
MTNYYEILGIERQATPYQIRSAYYDLVKKWHPDKYEGNKLIARRKLADINKAYETLKNEDQRRIYDKENPAPTFNPFANFVYSDSDSDSPLDMEKFKQRLKEINDALRKSGVDIKDSDSDDSVDYGGTGTGVGGMGSFGMEDYMSKYKSKGTDIQLYLDVTLEEIFKGVTKKIKIPKKITSKKTRNEVATVKVKMNMEDGESILIPGAGNHIYANNKVAKEPGDATIYINIVEHPIYRRKGLDLLATLDITDDEARNGFTRTLKGINGKTFDVTIDRLEKSNYVHVEKGKGLRKNPTGKTCGDVYIDFAVSFSSADKKPNNESDKSESEEEKSEDSSDESEEEKSDESEEENKKTKKITAKTNIRGRPKKVN